MLYFFVDGKSESVVWEGFKPHYYSGCVSPKQRILLLMRENDPGSGIFGLAIMSLFSLDIVLSFTGISANTSVSQIRREKGVLFCSIIIADCEQSAFPHIHPYCYIMQCGECLVVCARVGERGGGCIDGRCMHT